MFLSQVVCWQSLDIQVKFYGDRPRGTPPYGGVKPLNTKGVAKYSDFGPVEGYISETGGKLVLITNRKSHAYKRSIGTKLGDLE